MNAAALRQHYAEVRNRLHRPLPKPQPVIAKVDQVEAPPPPPVVIPFEGPRDVLQLSTKRPQSTRLQGMPVCPPEAAWLVLEVLEKHGLVWGSVVGSARFRPIVECRHEVWLRLHEELGWAFARIGRFCGKDHTTILHAWQKAQENRLALLHQTCKEQPNR